MSQNLHVLSNILHKQQIKTVCHKIYLSFQISITLVIQFKKKKKGGGGVGNRLVTTIILKSIPMKAITKEATIITDHRISTFPCWTLFLLFLQS